MTLTQEAADDRTSLASLSNRYLHVRSVTPWLCRNLQPEDYVVQSMDDVSPAKWHLAHVTWFFERFVLAERAAGYRNFDDRFHYLFNSYYQTAGPMHARPERGLLSRPTVAEVLDYRAHVDEAMHALIESGLEDEVESVITLGLHHEQQHQELLLTDIKHVLSCNPLHPVAIPDAMSPPDIAPAPMSFDEGKSGIHEIGHNGDGFAFDNETPRHPTFINPHRIGSRLVTNAEYREFIRDGGYSEPTLWLSDGWAAIRNNGWNRPLYWSEDLENEFTLGGLQEILPHAPVAHVSYYEADAFARWAGARLPTEAEWEVAAADVTTKGNFVESGYWHPVPGEGAQYFGDVWEWTASPYVAYPGFEPLAGSLGEYNGKFMCNQVTVRGGSCATAADHIRASYRSFFYPDARWQFLGIRLATNDKD
jgi:ergothioneine biosynthesis protein EgtB